MKKLNYNIYDKGTEYNWHIDAVPRDPVRDIKLTALLNLSEEYEKTFTRPNYNELTRISGFSRNGLISVRLTHQDHHLARNFETKLTEPTRNAKNPINNPNMTKKIPKKFQNSGNNLV